MWLVRRPIPVSWWAICHGVRPTRPRSPIPVRIALVARYHGSPMFQRDVGKGMIVDMTENRGVSLL
jgi:hypothetical protein